MADYPPFMNAYGPIPKMLEAMQEAMTPERFTQDFLQKTLGFSGGNYKTMIPLLKRIGLLGSDGAPTDLYKRFRNKDTSKGAVAEAIRKGYSAIYQSNENAHTLSKDQFKNLVLQVTGLDSDSSTARAITETFFRLKEFADFAVPKRPAPLASSSEEPRKEKPSGENRGSEAQQEIRFAYTIYLNLPNTDDVAVFNAIFKSLKDHLLSR